MGGRPPVTPRERSTTQSSRRRSRSRSRDRDSDRGRDGSRGEGSRRNRSRERRSRRSSRSRSRSRNRAFGGRGSSPERGESGRQSSPRRERRPYNSWRNRWGNDQSRREDQDKLSGATGREGGDLEKGGAVERLADRSQGHNSDGVRDKGDRDSGFEGAPRWEDLRGESSWNSEGGYGRGRGRGGLRDEPSQNRWQSRNSFSGTTNSSGNDSYSRFNENQSDKRRGEGELSETLLDRSGWSSASSRAVRRTLPADVQSYYSRRGRNSGGPGGGWNRQEEETPGQDPHHNEAHALPRGECSQLPLATQPQPQPMAILQFPMPAHVPPMTLAPPPFSLPPQVPVPIHSAMPLYQGLPPPPPPPPPLQQADGQPPRQAVGSVPVQGANRFCAPGLLGHPKAPGGLGQPAVPLPSSTTNTQPTSKDGNKVEAYADSSKKEKKLQIQERAVQEVKNAIKPYYQNKDISKDEYKEIVRKAVEKVCHSKSGEVNSGKVANLVKAYVDKYKHARKNKPEVQSKS
ncbi:hypothetical protein AGOR_G00235550 [Albula goreensis]|uniref:SFR19-like C-terminal domain-containing protein n=1 Tax=Albula goreensis TaxID=1534307 RepID=A0A8T3CIN6_9TELE|nr:hypothetical protein AGOR_G00235550 [Albula goreensis]